jgi:hypothetical protein
VWKTKVAFPTETTKRPCEQRFSEGRSGRPSVENWIANASSILRARLATRSFRERRRRETHLPAERTPAQAAARVPRANGHARGSRDLEAPPRERAQASLCLRAFGPCSAVIGSPARGTSTPSIGTDPPPPRATSSCTGFRAKKTPPERHAWDLRFPARSARRSSGTG